jgi:hypothetical protein
VRESELAEKEALKRTLHQKAEIAEKGMAIVVVVEKAAFFEANNYKDVSAKELDVLMHLAGNVGDMSATWRNVAYFCPDRTNLATCFLVCWHTLCRDFPTLTYHEQMIFGRACY